MAEGYGIIYKSFKMKKTNALWVIYFKDSDTKNAIRVGLAGRIREYSNSLYFKLPRVFTLSVGEKKHA